MCSIISNQAKGLAIIYIFQFDLFIFALAKHISTMVILPFCLNRNNFAMVRIGLAKAIYKSKTPTFHHLHIRCNKIRFNQGILEDKTSISKQTSICYGKSKAQQSE